MADPRLQRGAFARLGLVALIVALFLAPRFARADDCGSLASTQAIVKRLGGGALAPASAAQTDFLRAGLIAEPGADAGALTDGETLIAPLADGGAAVVTIVDRRACGLIVLGPGSASVLAAVGRAPASISGGGP